VTFIVYRSIGGYWEPQEWIEHRKFGDREEAEDYCREAGRRGTHMRVMEREDRMGVCRECKEWTTLENSCCSAPVLIDGSWMEPETE
jgi:hypothetical protein